MSLHKLSIAAALVVLAATGPMASAAFTVVMQQDGPDVVAVGSGSLDITGFTYMGASSTASVVLPVLDFLAVGPAVPTPIDQYEQGSILGRPDFGFGSTAYATSGSGDLVFTDGTNGHFLYVPAGYISGDPLSDTSTWADSTYSSLGITPGNYTWTWGSGETADSFTLEVNNVPEPASLGLFGVGSLSLLARRRRA
jgi:hypothetical protein